MDGRRVRAVASITTEPCRCYDGVCMILWRDLHVAGGTNMQGVRHAASMTACSARPYATILYVVTQLIQQQCM